jgi:allantoin racemase
MRVGVIRVLTTDDPDLLNAHGLALKKEYGFTVVSECIPEQPSGVHSDATFQLAVPKIAALASSLGAKVDALIVSCAADPGLSEAIDSVNIPVVGAGSAAAAIALTQGQSIGILNLTPETPPSITGVLGNHLVAAVTPEGVSETRHLLSPAGKSATFDAAQKLIDQGADVILLACTGMTSIGIAGELRERFNIPIVDPVLAAGAALTNHRSQGTSVPAHTHN